MDGFALYRYLKVAATNHAYDGTSIPAAQHGAVDLLAERSVGWFERLYLRPENAEDAWLPARLEYQFDLAVAEESRSTVLSAEAYHHGRLEWYSLDVHPTAPGIGDGAPSAPAGALPPPTRSFIPTGLSYDGMPHTRWWAFEDGRTNWGDVRPGTTDLAKLMLIEFGLVYANDWFLDSPPRCRRAPLARCAGLAVTNNVGERIWIEAAGRGRDQDWQRWSHVHPWTPRARRDGGPADVRFLLLPTVPQGAGRQSRSKRCCSSATRCPTWSGASSDQLAMVDGRSLTGYEAATDLRRRYERLVSANQPRRRPPAAAATLR